MPVSTLDEALPLLRRPFAPEAVKFKVQRVFPGASGCIVVAYIDARLVIERLNMVAGAAWMPQYEFIQGTKLMWCHLSVLGSAPRSDVGEAPAKGLSKDLVSDALKRAAVHFGVGVSVYALREVTLFANQPHVERFEKKKANGAKEPSLRLTEHGHTSLRAGYAKWLEDHPDAFGEPLDHGDRDGAVQDESDVLEDDFTPTAPPALEDDEAKRLEKRIWDAFEDAKLHGYERPPAQLTEWVRGAAWSHDALRGVLEYVENERDRYKRVVQP